MISKLKILLFSTVFLIVRGTFEFRNLKCTTLDRNFSNFEYCHIKAVNRSYKYMALKVNLYKLPVTNVSFGLQIKKNSNGYRNLLYNVSIDACKFLKSTRSGNIGLNFFTSLIKVYSNFVHPCPFNHDLVLQNVDVHAINEKMMRFIPIPEGEYAFMTTWTAYNIPRAHVDIYGKVKY